jgi:hypothetical protein
MAGVAASMITVRLRHGDVREIKAAPETLQPGELCAEVTVDFIAHGRSDAGH